ncbi:hypothetical protein Y1Q_0021378 [Alligator mississippiensis]|uniref:Uncharacterized protein n=1 Tax=Alligator mississippiensis TaxID=8496 RepID=A0A151P9G0_ALLMI|nr:hypothetical protein Y1Q_0021378 [Alligator mississippiensis]
MVVIPHANPHSSRTVAIIVSLLYPWSSDFGTLYTKLNLQPGIATVIDNFYICPTNKKKMSSLPIRPGGAT